MPPSTGRWRIPRSVTVNTGVWVLFITVLTSNVRTCAAESQPNIVLLLADDLGWTGLRCFGSDLYETPNLDRLADSGMKFTRAYAACTVCSPTRASIMTGLYPARLHLTDFIAGQNRPYARLSIPDWTKQLQANHTTIAERLKQQGYRTGHVGKWHLAAPKDRSDRNAATMPLAQGFDVSISKPANTKGYFIGRGAQREYVTDWLTDQACKFVGESTDQPFFLYFAYHTPHTPIQGRPDLVSYFEAKVDPKATHTNPTYAAMVKSLDMSVGSIVDTLKKKQLLDDTLIVFISDNGGLTQRYGKHDGFTENLPLRRGKGSAYEGGVRVPMIATWPGRIPKSTATDEPVMTIDFLPTFVRAAAEGNAAAQIELSGSDSRPDGLNLLNLFEEPETRLERDLYWHYPHYHAGGDGPYSAILSGEYRLIHFYEDDRTELYNIDSDPGESMDLSGDLPKKSETLRQKLQRWLEKVNAQMPVVNPEFDPKRQFDVVRQR